MDIILTGADRLAAKLRKLPDSLKAAAKAANEQCADDFMSAVRRVVPRGGKDPGQLARTLAKGPGKKSPLSVQVSIGGPEAPYAAHLEFGHLTAEGVHVPAVRFWFPVLRVNRKRYKSIRNRAANKALKALATASG
jgi:hypothetical protein